MTEPSRQPHKLSDGLSTWGPIRNVTEAAKISLPVREAAHFHWVYLVNQFTKLASLPLIKSRGFPAPYLAQSARVPRRFQEWEGVDATCR